VPREDIFVEKDSPFFKLSCHLNPNSIIFLQGTRANSMFLEMRKNYGNEVSKKLKRTLMLECFFHNVPQK